MRLKFRMAGMPDADPPRKLEKVAVPIAEVVT